MSFASRLKQAMDERKMSQSELSAITKIGKSSISRYLSGKNVPKGDVQTKIAVVLDCTVAFLNSKILATDCSEADLRNVSVADAARILDKSAQFIRVALQTGTAPFGFASKNKTKWLYHISPQKLYEYIST